MRVCELTGVDPAVYFTETDRQRNAIRDAAATVIAQNRAEEAERQRMQQQLRKHP